MNIKSIQHLDFEISSICNAGCTVCPRRRFGSYGNFEHTYWSISDVIDTIDVEIITNLKTLTLCGNFGDPMGNPDVVEIIKYFIKLNPKIEININTNGGIGNSSDYEELGKLGVQIMFGLDGVGEKNELYRVNVKWDKILKNINSFIKYSEKEKLFVQFLMWSETTDQVIPMIDFIKSLGKGNLLLKKPFSNGGRIPVYNMKSELTHFLTEIENEQYLPFYDTFWKFDELEKLKNTYPSIPVKKLEIGDYKISQGVGKTSKVYEKTDFSFDQNEIDNFKLIKKQTCYSKNYSDPSDLKSNNYHLFITHNKMIMPCCLIPPNISISMNYSDGFETSVQKEILNKMLDLGYESFSLKGKKLKEVLETNILDKFIYDDLGSGNELKVCKINCGKCQ